MESIDANISRLKDQILDCEKQLVRLRADLENAESKRRNQTISNAPRGINGESAYEQSIGAVDIHASKWPLSRAEYRRYGRQLIMPEVGLEGQLRLRSSRVLIVGAGGLGCPAAAYLAGAGVGTLGLVDGDTVEESNLHRQILHSTPNIGMKKVDSAIKYLHSLNPNVKYIAHDEHLRSETAIDIFDNYDLVLDCTDNPATRYLVSDTCILLSKPLVSASALKTDGQLWTFNYPARPAGDPSGGPCYRCMFPKPPPPESVLTCGEGGILGPVVGVMGVLQALETIKIITSGGLEPHDRQGRKADFFAIRSGHSPTALMFSARNETTPFRAFKMRQRRKLCQACSDTGTVTRASLTTGSLDYAQFCGALNPSDVSSAEERVTATEYNTTFLPQGYGQQARAHVLIDTREPVQFRLANIEGSCNIPFSLLTSLPDSEGSDVKADADGPGTTPEKSAIATQETISSWLSFLRRQPETPVFTVCRLGNDSQVAVQILKEQLKATGGRPHHSIKDISGGLASWRRDVDPDFPDY